MNTELSLAIWMSMDGGKLDLIFGIMARTASLNSKGLAVALRMTPMATEERPLSRVSDRSAAADSSTLATSPSRMGMPLTDLMMVWRNSSVLRKSVMAVTLNSRDWLSTRPAGTSRLLRRKASSTSWVVNLKAAKRSGSIQMRMEYLRSP